jgi:ribose transport system ATP-binding protein
VSDDAVPPAPVTGETVVSMKGMTKRFGQAVVLDHVDFAVRRGEVHALAGENGAGKSTLMKILQGVYAADSGWIEVGGRPARITSTADAQRAGIGMVFQEFSLVPSLSVAKNIFLNREKRGPGGLIDDRGLVARSRKLFERMGVDLDPRAIVEDLPTAYWQLTEIAKAMAQDAQVLIMDEPTASLSAKETESLFELIRTLTGQGVAIIYISHRMEEIYSITDRITVLRDGKRVLTENVADLGPDAIVEAIIGRRLENALEWRPRTVDRDAAPVLEAHGLTTADKVRDVSFSLQPGEILGLAGLMGSGRTELARALFGVDRVKAGELRRSGRRLTLRSPRDAIKAGIALVPEDRRVQGLVLDHSIERNLLLPRLDELVRGFFLSNRRSSEIATDLLSRLQVKGSAPGKPVSTLSGGNQQKVVIGKWVGREPDILILDEPTAGVDIGTKREIIDTIRSLADSGKSIVVISSEFAELLAVSDRVLVLRDGTVEKELLRGDIADEESLQLTVQGV